MADNGKRLAWLDVESTGIRAENNALLEVAAVVTDTDLNILDETGYHAVIYYPETYAEEMRTQADEVVQHMHDDTGLWLKLPHGKLLRTVDAELAAYFQTFADEPRQMYLAGNSIHLDRSYLETYLPSVTAHLHYRSVDVTGIALLAQWWLKGDMVYHKQYTHSARKDIRESIAELRFHREQWMLPPF